MSNLNGWNLNTSEDGQYLYIEREGKPGQIHVKADDEGFVVDVWTYDGVDEPECVASTYALYDELTPED